MPKEAFRHSPACARFMSKKPYFRFPQHIRPYFILQARKMAESYGLKLVVWEDGMIDRQGNLFKLKGAERTVTVNTWRKGNFVNAAKLAQAGFKVRCLVWTCSRFNDQNQESEEISLQGF